MLSAMFCSVAGSLFDHFIEPTHMVQSHDGMMFSTMYNDHDLAPTFNCALSFGGGWWFTKCSLWCSTTVNPLWFNIADYLWYSMENVHMMVKLQ